MPCHFNHLPFLLKTFIRCKKCVCIHHIFSILIKLRYHRYTNRKKFPRKCVIQCSKEQFSLFYVKIILRLQKVVVVSSRKTELTITDLAFKNIRLGRKVELT